MPKPTGVGYIGIDPGKSGGMALIIDRLDVKCRIIRYRSIPDTVRDLHYALKSFHGLANSRVLVAIEKVRSSPQMGVTSAFTFGYGLGALEMALVALRYPLIDPDGTPPQVWQKGLCIPPRRKAVKSKKGKRGKTGETDAQWKTRLRDMAQKMYPKLSVWTETKAVQLSVCDAILIAEYCRRKDRGIL